MELLTIDYYTRSKNEEEPKISHLWSDISQNELRKVHYSLLLSHYVTVYMLT